MNERNRQSLCRIMAVAALACTITVVTFDMALLHEMSGIFAVRPFEVILLVATVSVLLSAAILLYPLLLIHHRKEVFFEEEVDRLNTKYQEGMQEFQKRRVEEFAKSGAGSGKHESQDDWINIMEKMAADEPDYQDFVYLHMTLLELLEQNREEIEQRVHGGKQTFEQAKKDILRSLINATAEECLEDRTYDLYSYVTPVSYCMLAVAFGFIVTSLILFLGTGTIQLGNFTINLVWAAGGFVGTYIYSFLPFFQRCTRKDMPPRAYLHYALRVFLGPIAVAVFGNLALSSLPVETQFPTAVVFGSIPFLFMAQLRKQVLSNTGWFAAEDAGQKDVFEVSGITYECAERLHEEGINNIQNLAFSDPEKLSKRTMFNQKMLFDWKDEAILRLLTANVPISNFLKQQEPESPAPAENKADSNGSSGKKEKEEKSKAKEENLYDALKKVGISNVSNLVAFIDKKDGEDSVSHAADIVKLLGWKQEKEYEYFLEKIAEQGKKMLGELSERSITAFSFKWEALAPRSRRITHE